MLIKRYEMGYTIVEFNRTLRGQFLTEQTKYSCKSLSKTQWEIFVDDVLNVSIKISEAPPRSIAMLTLPVLNVQFTFNHNNLEQQELFLKRFFKYFHKGGG